MKIESAAGEFEFEIEKLDLKNDGLVLVGKMGVWEAETTMSGADLRRLLRLVLSKPRIWGYLTRMFWGLRSQPSTGREGA
ncbi:hypothetical protein CSC94_18940 [Zhengella mangrovi]|uniref:Uncharacterized protein n=1 Tax=Zhengella mangrovi TaxID=1982044 RepID=A0A2G1QIR9_9HYPH|nr:hypothetical protein [Zhengella mangrovi]PHP65437.1 hypothetical protein CSC94_18940 [Zhengella mangrovi]